MPPPDGRAESPANGHQVGRRPIGQVEKYARRPVSRVLFRVRGHGDDHSSGPPIAERFSRPTRTPRAVNPAGEPARRPYSVLLQAGLAMPPTLPPTRWALTPPFHPSPGRSPGGLLSVALSLGSPRAGVTRRLFTVEPGLSSTRASSRRDRPAVWRGLSARERPARQSRTPVTLLAEAN